MATTTAPNKFTAIAATRCAAELHLVISLNETLLADHANGEADLTDDEYENAVAILDAARTELANRELMHAQAIIEYAATKGHPRAINHVAVKQAVSHLADLVRKYRLNGEGVQELVWAIDYDGTTDPETHWGEGMVDTFCYLANYCATLDESAETLFAEAGLVLGW